MLAAYSLGGVLDLNGCVAYFRLHNCPKNQLGFFRTVKKVEARMWTILAPP